MSSIRSFPRARGPGGDGGAGIGHPVLFASTAISPCGCGRARPNLTSANSISARFFQKERMKSFLPRTEYRHARSRLRTGAEPDHCMNSDKADIRTFADPTAAAQACGAAIFEILKTACREHGIATLAVSGGSTPRLMFEWMAARISIWSRTDLFWVDERCVPVDDASAAITEWRAKLCSTQLTRTLAHPSHSGRAHPGRSGAALSRRHRQIVSPGAR